MPAPKSTRVSLVCKWCDRPFTRAAGHVRPGRPTFCSRACFYAGMKGPCASCVCKGCGAAFVTKPSRLLSGRGKFCSRACKYAFPTARPLAERFSRHLAPPGPTGCILWTGSLDVSGYGIIIADLPSRRPLRAHRVAWEFARGPVPPGLHVLHRCDRPACVNVEHLFVGTHADNMADKAAKGRARKGATPGRRRRRAEDRRQLLASWGQLTQLMIFERSS